MAAILLALGAGASSAGVTVGVFEVNGCVNTLLLPEQYWPADYPELGPDVFVGTLSLVPQADGTTKATFSGIRTEQGSGGVVATGEATAYFAPGWPGVVFGPAIVGGQQVQNCIIRIGVDWLLSASLKGIGHVDGETRRVVQFQVGAGGELLKFQHVRPPSYLRD
jgi:hypothetical protein